MDRSEALFREARTLLPGGVSSPVRAYDPYPRFLRRGRGSRVEDADGRTYVDFCLGFGPLILGHAHPHVTGQVRARLEEGVLFGAPVEEEVRLARRLVDALPSVDRVRFVNTGTEATLHALRLARGATERKKVVAVAGGFHGAVDALLVKAGSGAATLALPKSKGVPEEVAANTILVPYNDAAALRRVLRDRRGEVAAFLLEPVLGNVGTVPPRGDYLREVREATEEEDVLLIFDEVITGFRLGPAGAQGYYGVTPDLTTLGKILGGGFPCAAVGGPGDLLDAFTPTGDVYQAGTFSGNPLSLTAGLATLEALEREGYGGLRRLGTGVRRGLQAIVEDRSLPLSVQGVESVFQLFFRPDGVANYAEALECDRDAFGRFFRALLDAGYYLPPSQFESNFLSTAHTADQVDGFLAAAEHALREAVPRS